MTEQAAGTGGAEAALARLRGLLRERLEVIADHALRERDPAAQLARLQFLSEEIAAWHRQWRAVLPARLNHFLDGASFQKALAFIEAGGG